MNDSELNSFLEFIHELADQAGEAILPFFRAQPEVANKKPGVDFDPVTQADRAAENTIRAAIKKRYPSHGIFGEEYGTVRGDGQHLWVIDPIDGTRGFISGLPTWGTLIGLQVAGRMEIGLMNQPYIGERYVGSRFAVTLTDRFGTQPLQVRKCGDLSEAVLCATHPDMFATARERARFEAVAAVAQLTRYGTDCYGYCAMAAGHLDLVVEAGLAPYDILPLIPIVEAAGGIITDWEGKTVETASCVVAAGDARVHDAALKLLADR